MTTIGPYQGFQGSVEYDDGVLLIKVLHIQDSVTTTCGSASEVNGAFREMVDDYIETCRELGEEPNRPFRGSFNVRIDPVLHKNVAMAAAAEETSLNAWVEDALTQKMQREQARKNYARQRLASPPVKQPHAVQQWGVPAIDSFQALDASFYSAKRHSQLGR